MTRNRIAELRVEATFLGKRDHPGTAEIINECADEIESLQSRVQELEKALSEAERLVKRMKEVYNDPHYLLVWASYQNHGGDYSNGPKWVDEFEALDAAIRQAKGQA